MEADEETDPSGSLRDDDPGAGMHWFYRMRGGKRNG